MNGEIDFEKVLQIEFQRINYIVTIKSDAEGLFLELEDKCTGDIWESFFDPKYIEEITAKTGSQKKYESFLKMLVNVLTGNDPKLSVQLFTHQDLQQKSVRKNGSGPRNKDSKHIMTRYLVITYETNYQRIHYPLPLDYIDNPETQRLKLTIRRLSQQLQLYQTNPKSDSVMKELSTMKHQNQLLKSKLRSINRVQSKQNLNNNSLVRQVQEENKQLKQEIATLKSLRQEQMKNKDKIIQEKDRRISSLESQLKDHQKNDSQYQIYEQKFNKLSKEASQLVSALQHSKQNEKKSQYKIANLEKQLQKMIGQVKKKANDNKILNSPRKSDNGSVKSNNSNSRKGTNNNIKKSSVGRKNSSVFDSDTQSSRMRKNNNGRVSPYRQSSRPLNASNSSKKKQAERVNAISKYNNISNLYKKDRDRARSRSRSRSRSVKKQLSPPSDNMQSSAVMTEEIQFSDNEENKQSDTMKRLRNRNKMIKVEKQKGKQKKNTINPIQQRISSIAQLMRKFRNNTQIKNE